jgi:hypothetical protein
MLKRPVAVAVMSAALPLLVLPAMPAAAVPNPDVPVLGITPAESTVPVDVTVKGSCPAIGEGSLGEPLYPSSARLAFPAVGVTSQDISLDAGGEFQQSFSLPGTLVPGRYGATLFCDSSESEIAAEVTVLPPEIPASLTLDRDSAQVGQEVTATGTCPLPSEGTDLRVNDETVGNAGVDPDTGEFGPVVFSVPQVGLGPALVSTSCGGSAPLTVVVAPTAPTTPPVTTPLTPPVTTTPGTTPSTAGPVTPSTTTSPSTTGPGTPGRTTTSTGPTDSRIPVPDLTGLTEAEAIKKLGVSLVLGNPTGADGRIQNQDPPPGTLVEPASAVTVLLGDVPKPSFLPLLLVGVLIAAMIGALFYSDRLRRRRHRERRWVDSQVRTDVRAHEAEVSAVPDSVPGLDLRLEVRRDPARLQFQEVGDVHD